MCLTVLTILYLTIFSATADHHEIHKRMTIGEMENVFQTSHQKLPKYRLVNVVIPEVQKRDTESRTEVKIEDGGTVTNLVLSPSQGFLFSEDTPVTQAIPSTADVVYTDLPDVMKNLGTYLEDPVDGAQFILLPTRNRRCALNGYLSSKNMMIRSLPDRLFNSSSTNDSNLHVIFEPAETELVARQQKIDAIVKKPSNLLSRKTRDLPETIYPKIMVVLDATIYRAYSADVGMSLLYQMMLWNAINLRYRNMDNPKIRINIARFIVTASDNGTPYLVSNMKNSTTLNAADALVTAGKHFYKMRTRFPLTEYDAIMIFTRYHLLSGGDISVWGVTHHQAICKVNPSSESFSGVAIIWDLAALKSGTPAHELGHLLGALDEDASCDRNEAYVMTMDDKPSLNNWNFSPCSIAKIREHLGSLPGDWKTTTCLAPRPVTTGKILPNIVIEKGRTLKMECQALFATDNCTVDNMPKEDECLALYCYDKNGVCNKMIINPPDGIPCDNGTKRCMRGVCGGA